MAKLNFNLKPINKKSAHINAVIRHRGAMKRVYTGAQIPTDTITKDGQQVFKYWDSKKQRVKGYIKDSLINARLDDWQTRFTKYIEECDRRERDASLMEITKLFTKASDVTPAKSNKKVALELSAELSNRKEFLTDAFILFIRAMEKEESLKPVTIYRYAVMLNQVVKYEQFKGAKVFISDVNKDFYYDIADFFISEQNNNNKSVLRKIKYIRTVMNHGFNETKIVDHVFYNQKVKYKDLSKANRVPLEIDERLAFWKFKTKDKTERLVCDAFLCSMYLGLRYGDAKKLKKAHISLYNKEGVSFHYIDFNQEKTINANSVPIPDFIFEIITRNTVDKGSIFKLPDNAETNQILQHIAETLELDRKIVWRKMVKSDLVEDAFPLHEKITFHFGRYTYTRILDETTLAERDIQKNLGHKRFATTEGYLKSDDMRRLIDTFRAVRK